MPLSPLQQLERRIWENPSPKRWEIGMRILLAVSRVVNQSRIKLFAASMTYNTLLAIVPLLAVLFTLLKSFGIDTFLQNMIAELLSPMGSAGAEVSRYLSEFVKNAQAGFLGRVGLIFLFYSVFALFRKIEVALNAIWYIDTPRSIKNQILSYLGAIMLTVIVAACALGLNVFFHQGQLIEALAQYPLLTTLLTYAAKLLSIFITAAMLAIIYSSALNTEVDLRAAFSGGLFCAVLWLPLTYGFAKIMSASSSYSVIYSSFAGLIILLVWLQILWLLFLSGSLVSYFVQFPTLLKPYGTVALNPAELKYYGHLIINNIVSHFREGKGAVHLSELISQTKLSHRQIESVLRPFLIDKVIIKTNRGNDYLLAMDDDLITEAFITQTIQGNVRATPFIQSREEKQIAIDFD